VVDPGVGGVRKPILIETENYLFVGPDNGLLTLAAEVDRIKRVINLSNVKYFLREVSSTFHGRDVFGPVAAHLSLRKDPSSFGEALEKYVTLSVPDPSVKDEHISGEVLYVDSFGNLITNIRKYDILRFFPDIAPSEIEVCVKGTYIIGIVKTYSLVEPGTVAALVGSSGALEVAVNGGSAAKIIGVGVGEPVTVKGPRGEVG
jgi:S-adenosylmethionine hydrolase